MECLNVRDSKQSKFYNIWTTGAFTAYSMGYENGGILRLIENFRNIPNGEQITKVKINLIKKIVNFLFQVHKKYLKSRKNYDSTGFNVNTNNFLIAETQQLLPNTVEQLNRIRRRRDIVFSQALTAVISSIYSYIILNEKKTEFIRQTGFLIYCESFLTCSGEEKGMLEDLIPALDDIERCKVIIEHGDQMGYDITIEDDFGGNLVVLNSLGRYFFILVPLNENFLFTKC